MSATKWFDRQFNFDLSKQEYANIYKRLQQAAGLLQQLTAGVPDEVLVYQPEGKWSIKEHIGHLALLEHLWQVRLQDILQSKPLLTPTDLENRATTQAGFNSVAIAALINMFAVERTKTLALLNSVKEADYNKASVHPRMQKPMRVTDQAYFTAEHDDHHINAITNIISHFK